ncbi:MAG: MinD/ParA family protein [Firmicutes bacterium]|jgi:flagellar biosynthesis protein FlhG|nr:MinD/ParA family protein [Bacillota bacterium]NLO65630.1 MinD/ParA family protein [Bacillota bacterium]
MRDQAVGLRKLVNKGQKSNSRVIVVASGKGGVGKTNIAVNLALALRQLDNCVALIDVDLGLANVDIVLGITPPYNLGHVFRGEKTLVEIIEDGPLGIKLLAGGSGMSELANLTGWRLEQFVKSLDELNREFDFVVLDTGAGIGQNVLSFALATDEVLVVTTPEPTAITDAYGLIKVVFQRNPQAQIRLIVNMARNPGEAEAVAEKLNSVLREYVQREVEYIGYLLDEQQVNRAVGQQVPFLLSYPSSMASRSIKRIANILAGEVPQDAAVGIKGFFSRVYQFFQV